MAAPGGDTVNTQLLGDLKDLETLRSQQHDARTLSPPNAAQLGLRQPDQLGCFFLVQCDRRGNSRSLTPTPSVAEQWR